MTSARPSKLRSPCAAPREATRAADPRSSSRMKRRPQRLLPEGAATHRPVSRVLSNERARPDGHFSRRVIAHALQQPTRGVLIGTGTSLAAYLALLQPGFTYRHPLPEALWALTPLFSPLPVPAHASHRRFGLCGTFRRAIACAPRRYLAACPSEPGLSSRERQSARSRPSGRCVQQQR